RSHHDRRPGPVRPLPEPVDRAHPGIPAGGARRWPYRPDRPPRRGGRLRSRPRGDPRGCRERPPRGEAAPPRRVVAGGPGGLRRRDGSWRVLEGVGTRMTDIDGEPVVVLNSRDVTDRKRTEAREAGQKRVLEAIARGAALPDALATLIDALDSDLGTASAFV